MKLYLISQTRNNDYDTYDSAVVAAESEKEAAAIHPSGKKLGGVIVSTWVDRDYVAVKYIGEADFQIKRGVILASYNAG